MLALKYRPTTFAQMIGQKLTAVVLDAMVKERKLPQGFLFVGPSGVGKTTAARILASTLNKEEEPVELDGARAGGVGDIRGLTEMLRYGHTGEYRIVILDEAHSITRDGFNALLKTLEEPPSGTIFVLCSTEPEKIPETVKSRLVEFEFFRVPVNEISLRLSSIAKAESITVSDDLLLLLAENSDGSVRRAIMSLDQCWKAQIQTVEKYRELVGITDGGPDLLAAVVSGDAARVDDELTRQLRSVSSPSVLVSQLIRTLRDLQVIRSGGSVSYTGKALEIRHDLAMTLEPERVFAAMKTLWDLKTRIRMYDDPRGNLELALAMIEEVFTRGRETPANFSNTPRASESHNPSPSRKLSLSELREKT